VPELALVARRILVVFLILLYEVGIGRRYFMRL
jgi:hypothetical protein